MRFALSKCKISLQDPIGLNPNLVLVWEELIEASGFIT